jgi:hypothetical protein
MLIHGYAVSSIATNLGQSRQAALIRKEQSVIAIPDIAPLIRATSAAGMIVDVNS